MTLVFSWLRVRNLKLSLKKCEHFQLKVRFLSHVLNEVEIAINPEKVTFVKNWPTPQNVTER